LKITVVTDDARAWKASYRRTEPMHLPKLWY